MATDPRRQQQAEEGGASGWAVGGVAFAGTVMVVIGVFQVIAGLAAI